MRSISGSGSKMILEMEVEVEVKCRAQKRIVTVSEMNLGSKISLVGSKR